MYFAKYPEDVSSWILRNSSHTHRTFTWIGEFFGGDYLDFNKNREAPQYEASVEGAPVVRHLIQAGQQFFPTDSSQTIRL